MSTRRLLILAPNWLGDAVMALPLIRDLRQAWPETTIAVAARKGVAPLYPMVPHVNEVVTLDGTTDVARLAQGQFDAALLLPNSFASAWLVKRAHIRERWGFARDLRRPLLTKAIPRVRQYDHQVAYYQALGTALGVAPGPPFATVIVPATAHAAAARLLTENGVDERHPYVVFAPGAAYGRAKQWLPTRFAELARLLAADNVSTVLVGAKGDLEACNEVAHAGAAVNLAGRTDLPTLAAILRGARAVVANDSGAMHLAAAVGVPVTAVFGPTNDQKTAPLRAAPDAPAPVIIATDVWCRPCMLRECPIDHRCMTRISAARVYAATKANTDFTDLTD
jgi:heptosyltransferase-2